MKVRRWLAPLLWAGVILFVTSVPSSVVPQRVSLYDKHAHFAMYGLFGVLLSRDISHATGRWRSAFVATAIATAFGAADEWHQRFVPGRSSELADWRMDAVGAALGALLYAFYSRMRRSRAVTTR